MSEEMLVSTSKFVETIEKVWKNAEEKSMRTLRMWVLTSWSRLQTHLQIIMTVRCSNSAPFDSKICSLLIINDIKNVYWLCKCIINIHHHLRGGGPNLYIKIRSEFLGEPTCCLGGKLNSGGSIIRLSGREKPMGKVGLFCWKELEIPWKPSRRKVKGWN